MDKKISNPNLLKLQNQGSRPPVAGGVRFNMRHLTDPTKSKEEPKKENSLKLTIPLNQRTEIIHSQEEANSIYSITEVKETKKTTAKKTNSKKSEPVVEKKTSSLSKKQKLIGGIVLAVVVVCFAVYKIGEKLTGIESVASKAFEQLSSKKTIDKKYLSVSLDSDGYFVSLEDQIEKVLDDEDIPLKYSNYQTKSDDDTVVIAYRDKEDKEKYKIAFEVEKDGKTMLFFDKYVITKIVVKKGYDKTVLYDPNNTKKLTLKTIKDSKVLIDGKAISKTYLDKKKSDKDKDVYVIKGIS